MATTSGDGCAVLREIAEIAVSAVAVAERAEAILVALQALIHFEGGPVLLADAATGGLMPLMSQGYDAGTRAYVSDPNNVREADVAGVSRSRRPIYPRDLPAGSLDSSDWREYLEPAGFRDGIGVGLFDGRGRGVGMIAVHTVSREAPTDSVRDVVGRVAPMIAYALEPLRSLTEVARVVSSAHSGIVLTRRGDLVALVGMSNHPP